VQIKHNGKKPDKIFDILDERKREIDRQKKDIKEIIEIVQKQKSDKHENKINLYKENGIKTVLYDVLNNLKKGEIMYAIGSRGDLMLEYFEYYFPALISIPKISSIFVQ